MKRAKIIIVGSGKLANAVYEALSSRNEPLVTRWESVAAPSKQKAILVHAGSGRQLHDVFAFCHTTGSVFVELSTGTETLGKEFTFPVVICSNTSILLVKFLSMWKHFGDLSGNCHISILESHQANKKSLPGTAVEMAKSIGFPTEEIRSIREPEIQSAQLGIPEEFLSKHAYHKIRISDGSVSIQVETKVLGHDSYAEGVQRIISAIKKVQLEKRKHQITEFAENGWI